MKSPDGVLNWISHLSPSSTQSKITLFGKLLLALSNTSSVPTSFYYRLTALQIIPASNIEGAYINLFLASYSSLGKKSNLSVEQVVLSYGDCIIDLVTNKHTQLSKFPAFINWFDKVYRSVVLEHNESPLPNFSSWEAAYTKLMTISPEDDPYLSQVQQLKSETNVSLQQVELLMSHTGIQSYLSNHVFHRLFLELASHFLNLSQFPQYNTILRFYLSIISSQDQEVLKVFSKFTNTFFLSIKEKQSPAVASELSYPDLVLVYDTLIEAFAVIQDQTHLMYVSNSLLSIGAKLRQQQNSIYLEYWRRSVSIELDLQEKSSKLSPSLPGKVERLSLALVENDFLTEALEIISDAFGTIAAVEEISLKAESFPSYLVWPTTESSERLFNIICRILVSGFPHITPQFNHLTSKVEASVLEQLLIVMSKSSRSKSVEIAVFIMERLEVLCSECPLRMLRVCDIYTKVSGICYDSHREGFTEHLLELITNPDIPDEKKFQSDIGLLQHQHYIVSIASLSVAAFSSMQTTQQYRHLSESVSSIIKTLTDNIQSDTFVGISTHINHLSSFLDLQGAHEKRAELLKSVIESSLFKTRDPDVVNFLFNCRLDLTQSLVILGYTGTAVRDISALVSEYSKELDTDTSKDLENSKLTPIDKAWLRLRQAESLVSVGETVKASQIFGDLFDFIHRDELLKIPLLEGRPATENRNHFQQRVLLFAQVCGSLAKLHIEEGQVESGISQAQKSIHFLQGFLKKFGSSNGHSTISRETIWQLTSALITSQILISMAYERLGIIRETCYFAEEAIKTIESTECGIRLAVILAFDAEVRVRMGNYDKSSESLLRCQDIIQELNLQDLNVLYYAHSAILSLQRQRLFIEETEYYALSDKIFSDLKEKSHSFSVNEIAKEIQRLSLLPADSNPSSKTSSDSDTQSQLRHSMSGLNVGKQDGSSRSHKGFVNHRIARQSYPQTKSNPAISRNSSDSTTFREKEPINHIPLDKGPSEIFGIEVIWNSIIRSQVHSLGLQDSIEGAITLLEERYRNGNLRDNVLFDIVQARNYYLLAHKQLSQDPVFAFVCDSAISIPSIIPNKAVKETYMCDKNFPKEAVSNIEKALQLIIGNSSNILVVCNATEISAISYLLNSIQIYLAAMKHIDIEKSNIQRQLPYCNLVFQEISRKITLESDRKVVRLRGVNYNWPSSSETFSTRFDDGLHSNGSSRRGSRCNSPCPSIQSKNDIDTISANFQNEMLESIPQKWAVVTVNVCSDTGNLSLCRYQKGRTPFQLNLPLNRHSSRDPTEESFSFDYGIQQLRAIIEASNASASVKRTVLIKTSEERHEWWKERYDLDQRLEELLKDAEYFWLGGFTGIFSNCLVVPHLFENLTKQFVRILRTHLPSRNWVMGRGRPREKHYNKRESQIVLGTNDVQGTKGHARLESIEIEVDPKVLELFVGLGDPTAIKDPGMLEDLVYFVLDILQFHGERNAYDEIDMDHMIIHIEDALRTYHLQAQSYFEEQEELLIQQQTQPMGFVRPDASKDIEHIVLVLDKKSQGFPWESLPSLRNQSVTRVPSLSTLSELLKQYFEPAVDPVWPILRTSPNKSSCHYILNPGKDLPKTQDRFESKFLRLMGWSGIVGKEPTEKEVARMLSNSDIMVYMGHGSGQQYIRAAKIKSLDRCCPTLLLGCSSGVLTEAGEYEPWGTPATYMVAGCPMLMANMWDVTDKDIDTFSNSMLERWGVLPPPNPGMKLMAMGEAVMKSRNDCNLKFLNGAAPVVYGIPMKIQKQ